jgi:hypothetical protein
MGNKSRKTIEPYKLQDVMDKCNTAIGLFQSVVTDITELKSSMKSVFNRVADLNGLLKGLIEAAKKENELNVNKNEKK